jgi:hypothetical protein
MKNKKREVLTMLAAAMREKKLYLKRRKFVNISQACEKTWVAFILALEYKAGVELHSGKEIHACAAGMGKSELWSRVRYLHIYHYEGSPDFNPEDMLEDIDWSIQEIKEMVK